MIRSAAVKGLALLLTLSACGAEVDDQGAPLRKGIFPPDAQPVSAQRSEAFAAFESWRNAEKLGEKFEFVEERRTASGKTIVLLRDKLSLYVSDAASHLMHLQAFRTIGQGLGPKGAALELQIISRRGLCDLGHYLHRISVRDEHVAYDTVDRKGPKIMCSLDFEYIDTQEKAAQAHVPKSAAAIRVSSDHINKVRRYLTQYYERRGAKVFLTTAKPSLLSLTVSQIKGEVIPTSRAWERLQIVISPPSPGRPGLLVLDGRLGSGLAPPGEFGYRDMEPTYSSQLLNYGRALASRLERIST